MPNFTLIDSHAHIQFPAYDQDRAEVIRRAQEAGVAIINVGTQYSTSVSAVALAKKVGHDIWATVGYHPGHTDSASHHDSMELAEKNQETFNADKFLELAQHPEVVAIGECGLDYYRVMGDAEKAKDTQKGIFSRQINIAKTVKKPLVIHCRNAFADLTDMLLEQHLSIQSQGNGVVHFFSGSWDDARKLLNLGFFLGFGGVVTFARDYDQVLRNAPLDHIVLETDAPYVAPTPYRGTRNEPAYIVETAKKIAEIRGIPYDEVARITTENAKRLLLVS